MVKQTYTCGKLFPSGTARYCPPEYFEKGENCAKQATAWSLGVLLFRMITRLFQISTTSDEWIGHLQFLITQNRKNSGFIMDNAGISPSLESKCKVEEHRLRSVNSTRMLNVYNADYILGYSPKCNSGRRINERIFIFG